MGNESKAYYEKSASELTESLKDLQLKLDSFVKATDLLVADQEVNIRFYNTVNSGLIVTDFSNLIKGISQHVAGLKQALKPVAVETATEVVTGESSES
jgi:hypothetical protein